MDSLRRSCRCLSLLLLLPLLAACGGPNGGPSKAGQEPPLGEAVSTAGSTGDSAAASENSPAVAESSTLAGGSADADDRITIRVGGVPVRVRVSQTPREKAQGLMFTERLPADGGMLFVFEYEHRPSFWMKNTPIDLDLAFIDRRGRIVEIRRMEALDQETIHRSRQPALYALEVNAGWFQEHGITVGDEVEF
jgi:hypothetical protein